MSSYRPTQTTQYRIKKLILITEAGEFELAAAFEELNIYDNIFTPCMSGNVIIRDALNFTDHFVLDGKEKIHILIDKGDEFPNPVYTFERIFKVYDISSFSNHNFTSKLFKIQFYSEEFLLSEQQKVQKAFSGLYSDFVKEILMEYLKVPDAPPSEGKAGMDKDKFNIPSEGIVDINSPNMTPFETIEWMTKRSLNKELPQYLFYETKYGYCFTTLDRLISQTYNFPGNEYEIPELNFNPKHIVGSTIKDELYGIRRYKIISSFRVSENTTNGAYAGKVFCYDPMSRKKKMRYIDTVNEIYPKLEHLNDFPLYPRGVDYNEKFDSRYLVYPFEIIRNEVPYIMSHYPKLGERPDNTQDYVFQRWAIFYNLMQRRMQIVVPGNFAWCSSQVVKVKVPTYTTMDEGVTDYNGKYLIVGVRHTIRYDKHETVMEVASDSTNRFSFTKIEDEKFWKYV